MKPIAEGLSLVIAELLSSGAVAIEGFGTFDVRRYRAYAEDQPPPRALPYFKAAPELAAAVEAGRASSGHAAPRLLERLGALTGMPARELAQALDTFLGDAVGRAVAEPERPVALGRLGLLRVRIKSARTGEPNPPSRKMVAFVASVWLRDRINGRPEPATAPSAQVGSVLAALPTAFDTADAIVRAAELAGAARGGANERTLQSVERGTRAALPALLRTILATYDVRSLDRLLPVALLDADQYAGALAEHRPLMRKAKQAPGVPFAREASGDGWCYCLEHGPEVWVFAAGPDEGAVHAHAMTLSAWLGASLFVAALRHALGQSVLGIDDVQAVLARLHALAPAAHFVLNDLPY